MKRFVQVAVLGEQDCMDEIISLAGGSETHTSSCDVVVRDTEGHEKVQRTVRFVSSLSPSAAGSLDVAVLVCRYNDIYSLRGIVDTFWPELDRSSDEIPFLVVTVGDSEAEEPEDTWKDLMTQFTSSLNFNNRYYGSLAISAIEDDAWRPLVTTCLNIACYPLHILWDRRLRLISTVGQLCLRRTFWMLDRDNDGVLSSEEILAWQSKMFSEKATDEDVDALKEYLQDAQSKCSEDTCLITEKGITTAGFLAVCHAILSDGSKVRGLWEVLYEKGIHSNGLPYPKDDIFSVRYDPAAHVMQLSHNAVQFFSSLYRPNRFPSLENMWDFTPECPWLDVTGLPPPSPDLAVDQFILCWKYVALYRYDIVIQFARYWGFKGDANLLFVRKLKREYRTEEIHIPSMLRVLVVGSPRCGKSRLIAKLSNHGHEVHEDVAPGRFTGIVTVPHEGKEQTLVYMEIPDEDTLEYISNPELMSDIDTVLMTFDANDPYSFSYIEQLYDHLVVHPRLPCIVVMTKADLPIVEQCCDESPEVFCQATGLVWPPVITSTDDSAVLSGMRNDVGSLNFLIVDTVHFPEAATVEAVPLSRRLEVLALGGVALLAFAFVGIKLLRRRK